MVGCRFSDKALVIKTDYKLCTKQKINPKLIEMSKQTFCI